MEWAAANDHVVVTHDLDFAALLVASRALRPSVVQVRSDDLSFERIGRSVVAALRQTRDDLLRGALVSVDVQRARLRLLPLRGV